MVPWMFSNGGDYTDADFKKSLLSKPETIEAMQWYVDLIHKYRVAPTAEEARAQSVSFAAGKVGLQPFGVYNSGGTAKVIGSNFEWAAMPIPRDPSTRKRAYDLNSEGFVVPKATRERGSYETALRYTLSFYSDPVMRAVAEQRGTLPIVRKWIESPEYLREPPKNLDVIVKTINDRQIIVGDHQQRHRQFVPWLQAVRGEVARAFSGENAPKPALAAAMAAGDQALAAA
jgi:multiple sugar transport system substrate-binding protein